MNIDTPACPIGPRGKAYGGIPTSGGLGSWREYEVGAQRSAEALHCILGSLGKVVTRLNAANAMIDQVYQVEKAHFLEEIGIVEKALNEYSRDIYVKQINSDPHNEFTLGMIDDIEKQAPRLLKLARTNSGRVNQNYPEPIYRLAKATYYALETLALALLDSLSGDPGRPLKSNAFRDPEYRLAVAQVRDAITDLHNSRSSLDEAYVSTERWLRLAGIQETNDYGWTTATKSNLMLDREDHMEKSDRDNVYRFLKSLKMVD